MNVLKSYKKPETGSSGDLEIYRSLCLLASIIITAFGTAIKYNYTEYNLIPTISISVLFALAFFSSLLFKKASRFLPDIVDILFYALSIKTIYYSYIYKFNTDISISLLIVIFIVNLFLKSKRQLFFYNLGCIILVSLALDSVNVKNFNPGIYTSYIVTIAFVSFFIRQYSHNKENILIFNALHDNLTLLPNRVLFNDRLKNSVKRAKRNKDYKFAVLFIDLDRFKIINDSLGHYFGDQLLIQISKRLERILRPTDTISRLGGDEFTIILDDLKNESDALIVAQRIKEDIASPYLIDGKEIFSSCSIGIALNSDYYYSSDDLLRNADIAMYEAKKRGRSKIEIFNAEMHTNLIEKLNSENSLRKSIERQELEIFYQPVVSFKNNILLGFEALIRWNHPEKGFLKPDKFLNIAKESGFIIDIDRWVLKNACLELKKWEKICPENLNLSISINISDKYLQSSDFIHNVSDIFSETAINPERIKLEISEKDLMNSYKFIQSSIIELKSLKTGIEIDDFGTAFTSINYLHQLPISALKIDSSFIRQIESPEKIPDIIRTSISLGKSLGIDLIAEGVENEAQLKILKKLDCDYVQGFYISRELNSQDALKYIKDYSKKLKPIIY